eukprot:g6197.t1
MRILATVFFAVTCVAVITQAAYVSEREAAAIAVEELINEHLHDDPADFEDFANERITFPDSDESFVHKDVDPGLDEDQLSSEEHDKLRESLLQFTDLETMHAHILKGYEKHERAEAAAKAAKADEEALRAAEDDETTSGTGGAHAEVVDIASEDADGLETLVEVEDNTQSDHDVKYHAEDHDEDAKNEEEELDPWDENHPLRWGDPHWRPEGHRHGPVNRPSFIEEGMSAKEAHKKLARDFDQQMADFKAGRTKVVPDIDRFVDQYLATHDLVEEEHWDEMAAWGIAETKARHEALVNGRHPAGMRS